MSATPPYAESEHVVTVLGKLGPQIAAHATVDIDAHLSIAHADVLERLHGIYGRTLPDFTDDGRAALLWAEARIAGAAILDILRASMGDDVAGVPERLRASAWDSLAGGVVGSPVGDSTPGPPPGLIADGLPQVSAYAVSNFADPYDPVEWTPGERVGRGTVPGAVWDSVVGWYYP